MTATNLEVQPACKSPHSIIHLDVWLLANSIKKKLEKSLLIKEIITKLPIEKYDGYK